MTNGHPLLFPSHFQMTEAEDKIHSLWGLALFLTILMQYIPPYLDVFVTIILFVHNVRIFLSLSPKSDVPIWFLGLMLFQIAGIISGFKTDHDPLDGEWGGPSEANEYL